VGSYAAKLDLQSKEVNDFIALLLQHHTTVDVTLAAFEGMFMRSSGKGFSGSSPPCWTGCPLKIQRSAYTGGLPVTAENDQLI
jgi:hypothetical protein